MEYFLVGEGKITTPEQVHLIISGPSQVQYDRVIVGELGIEAGNPIPRPSRTERSVDVLTRLRRASARRSKVPYKSKRQAEKLDESYCQSMLLELALALRSTAGGAEARAALEPREDGWLLGPVVEGAVGANEGAAA